MPVSRTTKWHGYRAMLNLPGHHSTGAIVAEIENTATWPKGKDRTGDELKVWNAEPRMVLQISNCDRSLSFDFSMFTPIDAKNSLHKLDTMIKALTKFREGFALEAQRHEDRREFFSDDE